MFKKALAGAKDMERKAKEYGEKAKEKTGVAVAEGEASEEGSDEQDVVMSGASQDR